MSNEFTIEDHLDALNDLVLELTRRQTKQAPLTVKRYCDDNDLDQDGFALTWEGESWVVSIAEDESDDETHLEDDEEPEHSSKMASALAKARPHYTKSKASSGKSSLHNGDSLATMLAGCEPDEVAMLADLVCEEAVGTHYTKYSHLNQGQIRMNSGNKIRGRIKREEILESTVIEVAKANLATLMAASDTASEED